MALLYENAPRSSRSIVHEQANVSIKRTKRKKNQKRIKNKKKSPVLCPTIKPHLTSPQGRNGQDMGPGCLKLRLWTRTLMSFGTHTSRTKTVFPDAGLPLSGHGTNGHRQHARRCWQRFLIRPKLPKITPKLGERKFS